MKTGTGGNVKFSIGKDGVTSHAPSMGGKKKKKEKGSRFFTLPCRDPMATV